MIFVEKLNHWQGEVIRNYKKGSRCRCLGLQARGLRIAHSRQRRARANNWKRNMAAGLVFYYFETRKRESKWTR